uniref:pentapeptide repeat-containing protein n=1 Tax=Methanosarcina siciliae TaxID=38027 RepID=UPI00373AE903
MSYSSHPKADNQRLYCWLRRESRRSTSLLPGLQSDFRQSDFRQSDFRQSDFRQSDFHQSGFHRKESRYPEG